MFPFKIYFFHVVDFFITSCERQGVSVSVPRNPSYTAVAPIFVDLDVKDKLITRHGMSEYKHIVFCFSSLFGKGEYLKRDT